MSKSQVLCVLVLASAYLVNAINVDRLNPEGLLLDDGGEDQIIGGTTVPRGQHPYMTYLKASFSFGTASCGGTVISNRYVVTAAHCVQDHKTGEIASSAKIHLKVYTINPMDASVKIVTATSIKPHPQYFQNGMKNSKYDIALLKMSEELPQSDYKLIVKLYMPDYQSTVTAVGWGITKSGATTVSSTLQQVNLKIGTKDECTNFWHSTYNHEYMMCGVTPGKSVCSGDSGGPIVRYSSTLGAFTQVGINSFVPPDANGAASCENGFAVFVRVSVHRDWINANSCIQAGGGFCPTWSNV